MYDALTNEKQFDRVVELSGAMQEMRLGEKPALISHQVGGTRFQFSVVTLRGVISNLSKMSGLCRHGASGVGSPASIRSPGSNSSTRARVTNIVFGHWTLLCA